MKATFAIGLFLIGANVWAITTEDKKAVEDIVNKVISEHQVVENSGIGLSVFSSKKIILQKGFGFKDQDKKTLVDEHTAFAIGSTTKAFTALGLKLLENNNQLNLTDKVVDHLKDFKLANKVITENATIEDLLTHRVGMPRHDLMWMLTNFSQNEYFHRMQYLALPEDASAKFRKTFMYNNYLFMTAGKIIEEVSGEKFESYIQKNILDQLDMKETFLSIPQNYTNVAEPYYKNVKVPHHDISQMAPAGSIYSTAADMTKWIQSLMNKKWQNQDDLFKARIGLDNESPSLSYGYGLGWMVNTGYPKASWYFHNGNIDGFSAFVLFSSEFDLGIVVLVSQNGDGLGNTLVTKLIEYEISKLPIDKSFNKKKVAVKVENIDTVLPLKSALALENKSDLKIYENPGYGILETYKQDEKLFASYYDHVWELKSIKDDNFNYVFDLILGADHYDFPLKVSDESIHAPFENGIPFVHFMRQ